MPNYIDTGGDITARRHKGSATSRAAFERGHAHHDTDEAIVFGYICAASAGITSKEIAARMDRGLNCISGRITALKAKGKIRETGSRRDGAAVLMVCDGEQQGLFGRTASASSTTVSTSWQ